MKLAILAALVASALAAVPKEPKSTRDCEDDLQLALLDSTQTQEERCGHLVSYSKCLGKFEPDKALEAKLAKLQQIAKCGEAFLSSTAPQIITTDNSLSITVDHAKEAVFHRHRRETVSVFALDEEVQQLTQDLKVEENARLKGDNDALGKIAAAEQKVADAKTAGETARAALKKELQDAQTKLAADTDAKLKTTAGDLDTTVGGVETKLTKLVTDSVKQTDGKLDANEKAVAAIVAGVTSAVPALACTNKEKDGDETDVDCGGAHCAPCAKTKKCKYSTDCKDSMCIGGTCQLCKDVGNGAISLMPGRAAACSSRRTQPSRSRQYIEFTTCGMTGQWPPTETDCRFEYSLNQEVNSLLYSNLEFEDAFQVFTAPVDGNYKWWVYGAKGGTDHNCCGGHDYNRHGKGGDGGRVIVTQNNVKAGTKFYIRIGQRGRDCEETHNDYDSATLGKTTCPWGTVAVSTRDRYEKNHGRGLGYNACGGFNGGGAARCLNNPGGSSGGGATDIRMCKMGEGCETPPGLDKRFVVAAGGGGAACEGNDGHGCNHNARWGGHGGADTGDNGYDNGYNGYGGTQSAGGSFQSGRSSEGATKGLLGQGGSGGVNDSGAGGGGYYGGGGADHNAGGGGGSNYHRSTSAAGSLRVHNNDRGNNRGEGYIRLEIQA